MSYPKVSIIILNWNGLEDTIECLESLKKITYPNHNVIVMDNGSEEMMPRC
jgi:GT2 family glycosyltransferase